MSDRRLNLAQLAAELQKLSGAALERRLEAVLHQTWGDGWYEHEEPEPRPNPYNILTRVPEGFLKAATDLVSARVELFEKNLNEHLFPGLFAPKVQLLHEPHCDKQTDVAFPCNCRPLGRTCVLCPEPALERGRFCAAHRNQGLEPECSAAELLRGIVPIDESPTETKLRYVRCGSALGMQSCNLPLGHSGAHEHTHCCLSCSCTPCICNSVNR